MKSIKIIFLIIIIASLGCIKQVNPKVPFANQGIVISGGFFHYVDNPDTTQYIIISQTVPYTQTEILPENYIKSALVKVANDIDTFNFQYDEVVNAYIWKPTNSTPIPFNKKYILLIDYQGNHYEGIDSMLAPVAIDSFYMNRTTTFFGQPSNPPRYVPRILFLLSPEKKNFYYWACRYVKFFDGKLDTQSFNPNKNSNSLLIGDESFSTAIQKDTADISRSIDPEKLKDTVLYITGIQYHISKQTYDYQNILGTSLGSMGPIATPSPPNIQSNVVCTTDKNKLVFGYFMAASVDVKNIIFPNP